MSKVGLDFADVKRCISYKEPTKNKAISVAADHCTETSRLKSELCVNLR